MTTFPSQLPKRAAQMIAQTADLVKNAHQRINTLGSQVSSLTPGSWEDIALSGGWSNLAGYIPSLAQIARLGAVQIVGHLTGGTTTDGTVIGTLDAGFFNTAYSHSFTCTVMTGAAAVSTAGTVSGNVDSGNLADPGVSGGTTSNGLISAATTGTSGSTTATTGTPHSHAAGSYTITNAFHVHSAGSMAVNNDSHSHTSTGGQWSATPVNYNTAMLTITTSGQIVLRNCPAAATQISFNETLPLVGA
jgi:hypothetical protein